MTDILDLAILVLHVFYFLFKADHMLKLTCV